MVKTSLLLLIIILSAIILTVILFGLKQFQHNYLRASINQVTNLSHLFVRQQTNLFAMLLINNAKTETLSENLDNLIQDNFILDAKLYAKNGELLAQSRKQLNLPQQLALTDETSPIHQQIVEPIRSGNGIEGFLRITFDVNYGKTAENNISVLFHHLYGQIAILFLCGILIGTSVHYCLNPDRYLKPLDIQNNKTEPKKNKHTDPNRRRRKSVK